MKMMKKYASMSDGHLGWITVAKQFIFLNPSNALPIHSAMYRAGLLHGKIVREEIEMMNEAGVAETTVTK